MVHKKQDGNSKMKMRINSNQVSGVYRPSLQRTQEKTTRSQYHGINMNKKQTSVRPQARDHPAVFLTDCPIQVPSATSLAHPQ